MKRWLKVVLAFLASVAILSAIAASINPMTQVPGTWEIFRNPTGTSQESAAGFIPVLSVHPSNGQGFGGSFIVSVDKSQQIGSASQYAGIYKEKVAQVWSSYGITYNSIQNTTLAGLSAFEIIYTVHFPASIGGDCPTRDIVTTRNGVAYILELGTCSASDANSNLAAFGSFTSSFAFL